MANIGDFINKDEAEVKDFDQMTQEAVQEEQIAVRRFEIPAWLKAPTGDGEIEDYQNHLLNFNKSRGLARIIRGVTGMFGSINFAVIDIFIGLLDMSKDRRKVSAVEVVPYGTTTGH